MLVRVAGFGPAIDGVYQVPALAIFGVCVLLIPLNIWACRFLWQLASRLQHALLRREEYTELQPLQPPQPPQRPLSSRRGDSSGMVAACFQRYRARAIVAWHYLRNTNDARGRTPFHLAAIAALLEPELAEGLKPLQLLAARARGEGTLRDACDELDSNGVGPLHLLVQARKSHSVWPLPLCVHTRPFGCLHSTAAPHL